MSRMTNLPKIYTAQQTITVSGTPEQLTAFHIPDGVELVIQAKSDNTGNITLGYSSATALNTGTSCKILQPSQAISYQVENTNCIWFDGTVSGDGVEISCESNV